MNRPEVYKQIEQMFGFVPQFFKVVPDDTLDLEWQLMKRLQIDEGPIPEKYRELIGVGIAATTKCQYCIYFHTEMARLAGATEVEIENAVHFAKSTAGWSTYLNGLQLDLGQFKSEIRRACDHVRAMQSAKVVTPKKPAATKHS